MLVKLGSILEVLHGFAFKSENYVEKSSYRLVTLGNFSENNTFKYNDAKATYYGAEFSDEFILEENDLIIPLTEQVVGLFGNTALVPVSSEYKFVLNQRVGKIICNESKVNKIYLHYLLATESVKKQLEARASGTRQRNISPENIYDVSVDLPPIEEQEIIASILTKIDKQIERNNAMVKKLQVLSQGIFNYYYSNNEKRIVKLKSIAEMYQPETITGSDFIENGKYLVYGSGGIIGRYDKYNHKDSELMISCRGLCGNISLSLPFSWIIGNQMIIKPFDSKLKYYLYNYLKIINLKKVETGSVQKQITRTNLENLDIELLDDNVLSLMEKKLILIHQEIIKTIT